CPSRPPLGGVFRRAVERALTCGDVEVGQVGQVGSFIAIRATTTLLPLLGVNETCCPSCPTSRVSAGQRSFLGYPAARPRPRRKTPPPPGPRNRQGSTHPRSAPPLSRGLYRTPDVYGVGAREDEGSGPRARVGNAADLGFSRPEDFSKLVVTPSTPSATYTYRRRERRRQREELHGETVNHQARRYALLRER